jgi:hypothetical protein
MSLKAFHICFVSLASALAFAFAGWALPQPPAGAGYRTMGLLSLVVGVGLIAYGFWFWKKIKRLAG